PAVLQQLAAADDDVAARRVDGDDLALDRPADVVADVLGPAGVDLGGGEGGGGGPGGPEGGPGPAPPPARHRGAPPVGGDRRLPLLLPPGLAVAEDDGPVLVLDGLQQQFDPVTRPGRDDLPGGVVEPLAQLDDPLALVADVDPDAVAADAQDRARDDPVLAEELFLGGQPVGAGVAEAGVQFLLPLAAGRGELAEQGAVDHERRSS